ncbi:MAG: DUF2181 domain-containing protein [Thermoleophilia bacterium]|nr:DUF2181 domain-containing protein [Thermoleophilia bacterium]
MTIRSRQHHDASRRVLRPAQIGTRVGAPLLGGRTWHLDAAGQRLVAANARIAPADFAQLMQLASLHPELSWSPGTDIATARNAHRTNTPAEMRTALTNPFTYLESDLRIVNGSVICAHDLGATDGMSLAEWLVIGRQSGRGLKLDIKERNAIIPALNLTRAAGIPGYRLIFNVTVSGNSDAIATPEQLMQIRNAYPEAIINLSVADASYSPGLVRTLGRIATSIGQPVMFPLRWDLVGPNVIAALRPFGKIAIWNDPRIAPGNIAEETSRLRSIGVDGMIDLRKLWS